MLEDFAKSTAGERMIKELNITLPSKEEPKEEEMEEKPEEKENQ